MQNAPCQMVQYGNYRAPDNNHAGVTATLRQLQEVLREGNGVRLEVARIVVLIRKSSDNLYAVASLYAIA